MYKVYKYVEYYCLFFQILQEEIISKSETLQNNQRESDEEILKLKQELSDFVIKIANREVCNRSIKPFKTKPNS